MIGFERLRSLGLPVALHLYLYIFILTFKMSTEQYSLSEDRPAYQSSTYQNNENVYGAKLAVDGNLQTYSLASNDNDNNPAFWRVDLVHTYVIRRVTIIAPMQSGQYRYLESFIVTVDTVEQNTTSESSTCYQFSNATGVGPSTEITNLCERELVGNYVTVRRNGGIQPRALGIAEVKVEGTPLVGNRASNQQTEQIGTYEQYYSSNAVDNNLLSCALANGPVGSLAWWQVDLGRTYRIFYVMVSATYTDRANQFFQDIVITVDSSNTKSSGKICARYNNGSALSPGLELTLDCLPSLDGRYVTIRRQGGGLQPRSLGLCNIYIIGEYILATSISTTQTTTTNIRQDTAFNYKSTMAVTGSIGTFNPGVVSTTTTRTDVSSITLENLTTFDSRLGGGAIAGVVIGCIAFAAVVVALSILTVHFYRKRTGPASSGSAKKKKKIPTLRKLNLSVLFSPATKEGNPATERPLPPPKPSLAKSKLSLPILRSDLGQYVKNQLSNEEGFKPEFKELSDKELDKVTVGQMKDNKPKNRFQNIVPYDKTLVPLAAEDKSESGDTYINASYITGYPDVERKYIATQGPKPTTVVAFWRMIWQQNVDLIVMITPLVEKGKAKCEKYWPDDVREKKLFGKFKIEMEVQDEFCDYTYREFLVENTAKPYATSRRILHMHFLSWCDKSAPDLCFPLLSFQRRVEHLDQGNHPVIVHCSAGIGRTGTFICIDYLLKQLRAESKLSVFNCVDKLRHQRMNMVQTADQYAFVYEAMLETVEVGENGTAIPNDQLQTEYARLRNSGQIEDQFAVLQNLKLKNTENRRSMGTQRENFHKNRQREVVAFDDCRPYLNAVYSNTGSNYINAVYVNSYRMKDAYTLTQCPLPDTVADFWSLVWDQKYHTIVLLDEIEGSDPTCPIYWPTDISSTISQGSFDISLCSAHTESNNVQVYEFSIVNSKEPSKELKVRLFQLCNAWPSNQQVPSSTAPLLQILHAVQSWHHLLQIESPEGKEGKTILQCIDGYTRCGLLAAALILINRMKMEKEADVFLSCRYVTCNRPECIDMDQYMFLHELAEASFNNFNSNGDYYNCQLH